MKSCIVLIILSLSLANCARETTIDLPTEPPKTVAVCHFRPGDKFYLEISRSQSVFEGNDFEQIEEADATISVEGRFWSRMKYVFDEERERFLWVSTLPASDTTRYTLSVRLPVEENPEIVATSYAPQFYGLASVAVDTAMIRTVQLPDETYALRVPLALNLGQLPPEKQYFAFRLSHEINVYRQVNGFQVQDYSYQAASSFTTDGRTLSLLNDISRAEPVVLVNEKYWSDDVKTLRLDAIIPFYPVREKPTTLFVEWRTLSEEFYRYHLSLARQGANLPLTDPDAVFNNVQNGYGNFSGYSVGFDTIRLGF